METPAQVIPLPARREVPPWLIFALTAVLLTGLAPVCDGLLSVRNLTNLGGNLAPLFILAAAQAVVLISGGIDLSLTSILAVASVAGGAAMRAGVPAMAGVAVMLGAGAAIGGLNGLIIVKLRLPPFMVTLISMMFFSGAAVWATESKNISGIAAGFLPAGKSLPVAAGMAFIAGIVVHVLLAHTVWGRSLRAVGYNNEAARFSGLRNGPAVAMTYVLSGALAGLAAVIYTARLETGSPVLGQRMMLDVVGAAVIGGISLAGGRGQVWQALGGALFLAALDNALNLMGLTHFRIMMVKGGVILAAAALDARRTLP